MTASSSNKPASNKPFATDPYDILLGHNRWANRVLLERCATLAPEQFHQKFDIGPGTLHDTLSHVIGAMFRWSDRIEGVELRPSIEGRTPGDHLSPMTRRLPIDLITLNDDAAFGFARVVKKMKEGQHLGETRTWQLGPDTYQFTVAAAIIHVTNHGMHHRAQCMNMFKRLGQSINADLDELEWQVAGEP
jgi:uncharacterized damage-inducible protein DinB